MAKAKKNIYADTASILLVFFVIIIIQMCIYLYIAVPLVIIVIWVLCKMSYEIEHSKKNIYISKVFNDIATYV